MKSELARAKITLSAIGIDGNPARLTSVRHVTLQYAHDNLRYTDVGKLYGNGLEVLIGTNAQDF